ncbi:hypothetical protein ACFL2V_15720 [Pseudomonadota bacterium]
MSATADFKTADAVTYHIQQLINNAPHAGKNKIHTDKLVEIFSAVTEISASDDMNNWQDADLQSGVAISPVQAARCLQETVRTQIFLKGVAKAIEEKLQQHKRINILYAGTGPYGLLLLPLLRLINSTCITATLLDIHPENIAAVKKIIQYLRVEKNVKLTELADATCWHPITEESFDLIISETMNNLLRREPQIAVFSHLQQYLKHDGELIPQGIDIGAELINTKKDSDTSIDLGVFFQCNKNNLNALHNGDMTSLSGEIALPEKINRSKYNSLKFTTVIDVYGNHQLRESQCSLNIPIYYHDLKLQEGGYVGFEYLLNDNPKFEFDIPQVKLKKQLPPINEVGSLKIAHIKRFWHKSQLSRANQLDKNTHQSEWPLDLRLMELLDLPVDKTLSFLYQEQPEFNEFEQWLRNEVTTSKLAAPGKINEELLDDIAL